MGNTTYDAKSPVAATISLDDGIGTTDSGFAGPASYGPWRIDLLLASNDDSVDHVLKLGTYDSYSGANYTYQFSVTVPAGAGYGAVEAFDILAAINTVASGGLIFAPARGLSLKLAVAMNTDKLLSLWIQGGEL